MPSLLLVRTSAPRRLLMLVAALVLAASAALVLAAPRTAHASAPATPPGCTVSTVNGSNATAEAIPDDDIDGLFSSIDIATPNTFIWDVDVTTTVTHTYSGHLTMLLYSPGGGTTVLTEGRGLSLDNLFNGVTWDDQSTSLVTDYTFTNLVTPPNLSPEGALGTFLGEDPTGIWDLQIIDDVPNQTGSLTSWSLSITTCSTPPPANAVNGSNSTPAAITDNGTITSNITISGGGAAVCGVEVVAGLRHAVSNQLDVTLRSPALVTTALSTDNGSFYANTIDAVLWSDFAEAPITSYPFSANDDAPDIATPEGALSALHGGTANGTWQLSVTDDTAGTTGTLTGWSLRVTTCAPPAVPQAPPAPSVSAAPTVTGTAQAGATVVSTSATWMSFSMLASETIRWRRCDAAGASCVDIPLATGSTYAVVNADIGSTLRVVYTADNGNGTTSATSTQSAVVIAATPPGNTVAPSITGTATDGLVLTGLAGTWTGTNLTYARQWRRCDGAGANCVDIPSATGTTYTLTAADVAHTIRFSVTASNIAGPVTVASNPTAVVAVSPAPTNTAAPVIGGTAKAGSSLTTSNGSWTGNSVTFTTAWDWQRCTAAGDGCVSVSSASSYRLALADVGSTIRVRVTMSNSGGSASATSAPTAVVAPNPPVNTAKPTINYGSSFAVGGRLTGSKGTWTSASGQTYAYRWMRCNAQGDACAETTDGGTGYTITNADAGSTLRFHVTATSPNGSAVGISAQSPVVPAPVVPPPPPDTVAPTVTVKAAAFAKIATAIKRGVTVTVVVNEKATITGQIRLAPKTAKSLKLPVVIGTATASSTGAASVPVTLRLTAAAKKKLAKLPKLGVTLQFTTKDPAGNTRVTPRAFLFKR